MIYSALMSEGKDPFASHQILHYINEYLSKQDGDDGRNKGKGVGGDGDYESGNGAKESSLGIDSSCSNGSDGKVSLLLLASNMFRSFSRCLC